MSKEEGDHILFPTIGPNLFPTTDVTGAVELPEGVEMVMPGDNVQMTVKLIAQSRWKKGFDLRLEKVAGLSVRGKWKIFE